jgi:hypothetical protein
MITLKELLKAQETNSKLEFEHLTLQNKDKTPLRCRQNGKIQVWKTRPEEFKVPVKYGLKEWFYITNDNAEEWRIK